MSDVQCLIDAGNHLGELPIWSAEEQALWWINCEQPPELHRWDAASGAHRVWPMPQRIGGFVHKASGGLLVVLADGMYDFDPATGDLSLARRQSRCRAMSNCTSATATGRGGSGSVPTITISRPTAARQAAAGSGSTAMS